MMVYPCGTVVQIGRNAIPAQIQKICIESGAISYQVSWWDGSIRCLEWLSECEVDGSGKERHSIGFHEIKKHGT